MRIETLWKEMEGELQAGAAAAWLTRAALPDPASSLLVALETASHRRALLLPLPKAAIPPRRDWPVCRGLELFSAALDGRPHWGVRLRDQSCADVFSALAQDVAPSVAAAATPRAAGAMLLTRLRRWQKFLQAGAAGLSPQEVRGLFGELHFLRTTLLPTIGPELALAAWRAPRAAHQDFQLRGAAIEIKTTAAKQPQSVRITSERQLDATGIPALFLHVLVLDEREAGADDAQALTLPGLVTELRGALLSAGSTTDAFDEGLLDAGYLEADSTRYEATKFTLRQVLSFHVRAGFPCLVEKNLPSGIGDVSYALSLAACQPFAVTPESLLAAIKAGAAVPRSRKGR